jgi:hypothetical protein
MPVFDNKNNAAKMVLGAVLVAQVWAIVLAAVAHLADVM